MTSPTPDPSRVGTCAPSGLPAPGLVAILGAGPTGLDAALACVDAGWACTVYEAAPRVGGNVEVWGHVRMFTPWSMNVSHRMRTHLRRAGIRCPTARTIRAGTS